MFSTIVHKVSSKLVQSKFTPILRYLLLDSSYFTSHRLGQGTGGEKGTEEGEGQDSPGKPPRENLTCARSFAVCGTLSTQWSLCNPHSRCSCSLSPQRKPKPCRAACGPTLRCPGPCVSRDPALPALPPLRPLLFPISHISLRKPCTLRQCSPRPPSPLTAKLLSTPAASTTLPPTSFWLSTFGVKYANTTREMKSSPWPATGLEQLQTLPCQAASHRGPAPSPAEPATPFLQPAPLPGHTPPPSLSGTSLVCPAPRWFKTSRAL